VSSPSFDALYRGCSDFAISSLLAGMDEIKRQGLTDIKVIEPPWVEYSLHHYLHKKHESLTPKIMLELEKAEALEKICRLGTCSLVRMHKTCSY